jgi:hypothetical protein
VNANDRRSDAGDKQDQSNVRSQIGEGASEPLYDRSRPLVQRLEYVAFHLPMIGLFQALRLVETPEGVLPEAASQQGTLKISPAEILFVCSADEARLSKRRQLIDARPELADAINLLLDWVVYSNAVALENFCQAKSVYDQAVLSWSVNDLGAIYTIWACLKLWEAGCDRPSALLIREKAIELWEETELLNRIENKLYALKWDRLFEDLGIPLKLPRRGWTNHNKK